MRLGGFGAGLPRNLESQDSGNREVLDSFAEAGAGAVHICRQVKVSGVLSVSRGKQSALGFQPSAGFDTPASTLKPATLHHAKTPST